MLILLLDGDRKRQDALAQQIRDRLAGMEIGFDCRQQHEVFDTLPDKDYAAIWLWIGGMTDLEAARLLARTVPRLPLIFYSSSSEYAIESYRIGACYYLEHPVDDVKLVEALKRCDIV